MQILLFDMRWSRSANGRDRKHNRSRSCNQQSHIYCAQVPIRNFRYRRRNTLRTDDGTTPPGILRTSSTGMQARAVTGVGGNGCLRQTSDKTGNTAALLHNQRAEERQQQIPNRSILFHCLQSNRDSAHHRKQNSGL